MRYDGGRVDVEDRVAAFASESVDVRADERTDCAEAEDGVLRESD